MVVDTAQVGFQTATYMGTARVIGCYGESGFIDIGVMS
jgi:hypothetical protein